jgi:hypothetical protein
LINQQTAERCRGYLQPESKESGNSIEGYNPQQFIARTGLYFGRRRLPCPPISPVKHFFDCRHPRQIIHARVTGYADKFFDCERTMVPRKRFDCLSGFDGRRAMAEAGLAGAICRRVCVCFHVASTAG